MWCAIPRIAAGDFGARFDARTRTYRYTIVNRDAPDPFRARFAWWIDTPLDLRALRIASDAFIGEHDFASFCRKQKAGGAGRPSARETTGSNGEPSLRRRVTESRWDEVGEGVLQYEVSANAFCWQMVRSVVGTLVEVGTGKRRPGEMLGIIRAADRGSRRATWRRPTVSASGTSTTDRATQSQGALVGGTGSWKSASVGVPIDTA